MMKSNSSKFYLGVDLGKSGGICLMDHKGFILRKMAMPIHIDGDFDHYELEGFLALCKGLIKDDDLVIVTENVWGQPGSGTKQVYGFGDSNGYIRSLLHVWFHRSIEKVVPRVWQKWLFEYCSCPEITRPDGKRDTKAMALYAVTKLYPKEDLRASPRSSKPHDGIVDAIGLALYAKENLSE